MSSKVFMDVRVDGFGTGRLVFELFDQDLPKTCENFKCLCSGEKGYGYDKSVFHRIIPGFMAQGGDFTNHNGTGGKSIYGPRFDDEGFTHKHDARGLLSMANSGRNTNGSQFFVLFAPQPHLDEKHVVFGKLVEDKERMLSKMESVASHSGQPKRCVQIMNCGILF
jgi:cyclophilin family peptidyl-prolyl cis-trans isomerase